LIAVTWFERLTDLGFWNSVAWVACGLGFVIFVHELGHFLVAKACGVKCEKFYLGFDIYGLKLFKFQAGETEYGIGILPLGGYVKMLGQDDNPGAAAREAERSRMPSAAVTSAEAPHPEHLPHGDLPPEPTAEDHAKHDPRSYLAKSVPQRMAIISAGVIMNVIFAMIMAMVAFMIGVKEIPCVVGSTMPGEAAWRAGLRSGDDIIQLGDMKRPTFGDLRQDVPVSDLKQGIEIKVQRPGVKDPISMSLFPSTDLGVPMVGMAAAPSLTLLADEPARKYSPAAQAKPPFDGGDRIVAVDGEPVETSAQLYALLNQHAPDSIKVTVERLPRGPDGKPITTPSAKTERVDIEVHANPMKTLGLMMKAGPISAIQANSPAADLGIKVGDELVAIDGEPVKDPMLLPWELRRRTGQNVKLTVAHSTDNKRTELTFDVPLQQAPWRERPEFWGEPISIPEVGIAYRVLNDVVAVVPGSPAAKADIHAGDKVTSAVLLPIEAEKKAGESAEEKKPIRFDKHANWVIFHEALQAHAGKVRLEIESGTNTRKVELQPVESTEAFNSDRGLNLEALQFIKQASSFGEAVRLGGRKTLSSLLLVYRFLQKLGERQIPITMIGGPGTIAAEAFRQAQEGLASFLLFLTMLSANLAVINFLPIPVLDGGHMVFLALEGIRRKPVSERIVLAFHYAGFVFLVSLMLFAISLDLGLISRIAE
jgi:regulator of sigma E protease